MTLHLTLSPSLSRRISLRRWAFLSKPICQRRRVNNLNPQLIHTLLPLRQNLIPINSLPLPYQLIKNQQLPHPINRPLSPQLMIQYKQTEEFFHLVVCDADFCREEGEFDAFVGTDYLDYDLVSDGAEDGVDVGLNEGVGEDIFCVALEDALEEGDVFLLEIG